MAYGGYEANGGNGSPPAPARSRFLLAGGFGVGQDHGWVGAVSGDQARCAPRNR